MADFTWRSPDPCRAAADSLRAEAEARKTCEITNNCMYTDATKEFGGCMIDFPEGQGPPSAPHEHGDPGFERMYCIIGTEKPEDHVGEHGYDTDTSLGGVLLTFDSSKCGDRMINPEDPTQQISFDICDSMLAKHAANIADLRAAAADAAAELASLKAGLTCKHTIIQWV